MQNSLALEEPMMSEVLRASGLGHLAIIMDGNRRWARKQRLLPFAGHKQGVDALRRTALYANSLGLPILTVYAFSTENWHRPLFEVNDLMEIFYTSLEELLPELHENHIRLHFVGTLTGLSPRLQARIAAARELTSQNSGTLLQVAMNYGGRQELVQACRALMKEYMSSGRSPDELTEEAIAAHLYNPNCPDPDVILRTGGEHRLSNFLLWQAAYSEVMITDVLWPDFSPRDLDQAILEFAGRKRRFGR